MAVTISGLHFTSSIIGCVFEGIGQTSALLMSSTQISCLTPIRKLDGFIRVQLVKVGFGFVDGGALFDFQLGPAVTALSPNIVYGDGGYRVSIFGTSFDSSLNFCRIGSAVSPTERISSTLITCLTPKAQSGVVHLEIGSDSISSVLSTELLVQELPILNRVTPSVSSDHGGVAVTVNGLNFVDTKTMGCKFGDESVTGANFVTSSLIWCVTPSHTPGLAILQMTNNGYVYSRSTLKFQFDVSVTIGSIFPSRGPTSGGTVVSLISTNSDSDDPFFCSFGDVGTVTSSFQRDGSTVCVSQPRAMTGPIDLIITAGNQVQRFVFDYFQALDLHTVEPRSGPVSGGYDIHIVADFRDFTNLALDCRFEGTFRSAGRRISPAELVCQSPAHEVGLVSVELITEDNVPIATFFHQYVKGFTVNSFEPYSAPETGGTIVTIRGIFPSAQCYCMFGNSAPQACRTNNDDIVRCITVAHAAKTVLLRVSPDKSVWTNVGTFQFLPRTKVSAVSPERGACDGASIVTLSGSGFTRDGAYSCVMNGIESTTTKATYVSSEALRCSIPLTSLGTYYLTVMGAYSSTKLMFTCIETPQVYRIVPSFGSLHGGTPVRVVGKNFNLGMTCKFGDVKFSASLISTTELSCLSPRLTGKPEAVVVEVGMHGAELDSLEFSKNGIEFLYSHSATISALIPTKGFAGTEGQVMTVAGRHFYQTQLLSCRFGTWETRASFSSSSLVTCMAPSRDSGSVTVTVSNNAVDSTSPNPFFAFERRRQAWKITPSSGPIRGGTRVLVSSEESAFALNESIYCFFDAALKVDGKFQNESSATCTTPSVISSRTVSVSLDSDGMVTVDFEFYTDPVISEIFPSSGVVSSGSTVTVLGFGFSKDALMCRFGQSTVSSIVHFTSSTQVACALPPSMSTGMTNVEISVNGGHDYTLSGFKFVIDEVLVMTHLRPSHGPSRGDGKVVSVFGRHFPHSSDLSCRFGVNRLVPAVFLSSSVVVCLAPSTEPGMLTLSVSRTTHHNSAHGLQFYSYPDTSSISISIAPNKGPTSAPRGSWCRETRLILWEVRG